jgi:nucleotide-binding universal stress UspA family protein
MAEAGIFNISARFSCVRVCSSGSTWTNDFNLAPVPLESADSGGIKTCYLRCVPRFAKEVAMRILLAVDESENSRRVVRYVGALLRGTSDVAVTLFHVLKPMPRELLEHGGSENPAVEAQLSMQLRAEQEAWIRKEGEAECHILKQACESLSQSGFDTGRVTLKFGHEDDVANNILDEAGIGQHETIVVGRHGTSRVKRVFGGGVTDQLLRDAKGFALWVVE